MARRAAQGQTIAQLLRTPYRRLVGDLYRRLGEEGFVELQPAHASIFPYIREAPARSVDIAARAHVTKQAVGYLVDSLEAAGYVERVRDPADGRARLVQLTRRGAAAERAATRIIGEIESGWAKEIGREDARALRRGLERLSEIV